MRLNSMEDPCVNNSISGFKNKRFLFLFPSLKFGKAKFLQHLRRLFFFFCLFLTQTELQAQAKALPKTVTLEEAIMLSLRYNPDVQSAQLQRVLDKFNVALAQNQFEFQYALLGNASENQNVSNGFPQVTSKNFNLVPSISRQTIFGTQYNLTMTNPVTYNSVGSNQYFYNPSLVLSFVHPLMKGSGTTVTEANLQTTILSNEIAKLNLKNTIINQVTQVIIDYRAVVAAENALMVDQTALKEAIATVEQNKARIKLGFMAPSENIQAETNVANQKLQIQSDINAIIQAKLLLFKDIGIPSTSKLEVEKKISIKNVSYPKGAEAKRVLLLNNIQYMVALFSIKIAKIALLVAEDQQRWTLNLTGTYTQGAGSGGDGNAGLESLFNGMNKNRTLGLELSVPIDNLSVQQQLVSAKVGYSQLKLQTKQLKLALELQVEGAIENLAILFDQITLAKNAEVLANKTYLDALKKASYGQTSMFEVTTLQTSLISAQLRVIQSEIAYLNSIASYQQTLGITLDVWKINLVY